MLLRRIKIELPSNARKRLTDTLHALLAFRLPMIVGRRAIALSNIFGFVSHLIE